LGDFRDDPYERYFGMIRLDDQGDRVASMGRGQ
jgi:hypothetical protein